MTSLHLSAIPRIRLSVCLSVTS